jgi:predicted transcriptional regulator
MFIDIAVAKDGKSYFKNLRQRATDAGISCNRLALQSGIASTQISRWMRGDTDPRLSSIVRLELALNELIKEKAA